MPVTRFRLTGGLWSSDHCWVGKGSTGRGTSSGGGHCGCSGLFALRGLPQDAGPRSAAQRCAHSPSSEGRAMGVGCRAGAQVPRQAGRTGQRLQCTDACADERVELYPTRPRSQPVPARQEPAAPRDQAECCAAGPGWPGWRGTSGLRSWIAHYLEGPQLPEALGRATSRKPEHPGAVAALSSAGSEPGSTRAPRGRDTVRGQMPAGIPALCLTTTSPAATPRPSVFADLLPLPLGLPPKQDSGGSIPRQDTYSR